MIPAEAVEAAARSFFGTMNLSAWDNLGPLTRAAYRAKARAALESAAPYMQRTAATIEDLRSLPGGSVMVDAEGEITEKPYHEPRWWHQMGTRDGINIADIALPAKVLWEPANAE